MHLSELNLVFFQVLECRRLAPTPEAFFIQPLHQTHKTYRKTRPITSTHACMHRISLALRGKRLHPIRARNDGRRFEMCF